MLNSSFAVKNAVKSTEFQEINTFHVLLVFWKQRRTNERHYTKPYYQHDLCFETVWAHIWLRAPTHRIVLPTHFGAYHICFCQRSYGGLSVAAHEEPYIRNGRSRLTVILQ